ncbi:hypothetical protein [Curtobacterium sp. MCBD17_040]|uniref:hypothetical protein n=1 Tax=Curtobacterium sp. MCBD17_040 TaxID=2175674 RepID=UPI000DA715E8|nr:hypothetical protein [Curtobacterium sp. MCBD17_040]WIB65781.1 hypothetical protein DEI94_16840 [Curtobacterium sp. MCBD17_040]
MMNNSDAPVRVTITPTGEEVVEASRSVHEHVAGAGGSSMVTNISGGNVNLAQHSQHVTQTQDNRTGSAAALDLVDAIRAQIAELPATERQPVETATAALHAEAAGQARPALLRELSNKAVTAAVRAAATAGATDLVQHLMPHLQHVLTAVGA